MEGNRLSNSTIDVMSRLPLVLQVLLLILMTVLLIRIWPLTTDSANNRNGSDGQSETGTLLIPGETKKKLDAIEAKLANEASWPKSSDEIQQLHDQLAQVVNGLAPRIQEELLPRLVPRRWEIQALWLLANEPKTTEDVEGLSAYADEINSLASNKPVDSATKLVDNLRQRQKDVQDRAAKIELSAALKVAREAVNGKSDFERALRRISGYDDEEARKLVYQLVLARDLATAFEDLRKYEPLKDLALREYALTRLNQLAMDLRLRTVTTKYETPKQLVEMLVNLEKTVATNLEARLQQRLAESKQKHRDYQIWALNQIKLVPQYDALEEVENSRIPGRFEKNNPMSGARKAAARSAAKKLGELLTSRMAPISPALLDEAVAQWYRKVFQDRFDKLNDAEKLEVVKGFAETEKKLPN